MAAEYAKAIDRILAVLRGDAALDAKISEWRFGDMGDGRNRETNADSYPLCFVTTASAPEVDRQSMFPAEALGRLPGEKRTHEFWIILVAGPQATAEDVQKLAYGLVGDILRTLEGNTQLRDTGGGDPIFSSSRTMVQRRFEQHRGTMLEAFTVRLRGVEYT